MFLYNLSIDKDSLKMIQSPKAKNKRNRDIDVENGHVDTGGVREDGRKERRKEKRKEGRELKSSGKKKGNICR